MDSIQLSQEVILEWLIAVGLVVAVAIVGRWLIDRVVDRGVRRLTGRTQTMLDDLLVEALGAPLYWLLLVFTLEQAIERLDFLPIAWRGAAADVFFVLYFIVAFLLAWRLLSGLFTWYGAELAKKTETDVDDQLIPVIRRVTLLIVSIVALVMLLGQFGIEVTGLLATLGIGSLAIALAAQASLSDIFSGFVIMVDRPYRLNDRIEILDLDTWGDVVDIGLRSTRIRTRDNRMVIVPNSVIGKSLIVNHSFPDSHYRIETHVGIAYGTDVEVARRTLIEAASQVEGTWDGMPTEALLVTMGESALIFRVRVWIQSYVDTRRVIDRINTAIYNALNQAGIESPYPQRDVHHYIDSVDMEKLGRLLSASRQG